MDLRQLRCFITVAETLHFGQAAQTLDMLPASLGRQIRLLEEGLGCRLLNRTTRNVSLTKAGSRFVGPAREIIKRTDDLEAMFRQTRTEAAPVLRVGAIDSAAAGLMPSLLSHFRETNPDIDIQLLEQKTIRLLPLLLSGRLDIAIVRPPAAFDPRLAARHLFFETAVVAIPDSHPLAALATISVHDMADQPLIVPDRKSRPHSHDLTIKLFAEAGLTARVAQVAEEKQTIVNLVSTGAGLAIVPRWAARLAVGGVAFIPLDLPAGSLRNKLALSAVWLRDTRVSARDALLNVLDKHIDELETSA